MKKSGLNQLFPLQITALSLVVGLFCTNSTLAAPPDKAPHSNTGKQSPAAPHKTNTNKQGDQNKNKSSTKTAKDPKETKPTPPVQLENVIGVSTDELVNKPHEYLSKNVKFNASFYSFSNLALDYKPALKSSKTYLSFMVLSPRYGEKSKIPLSELKLAMLIPKEKDSETAMLAGLKEGDKIEVIGKVFSDALDDPWVEVFKLKKLGGDKDKSKDKDADKKADAGTKNDNKSDSQEKPATNKPSEDAKKDNSKTTK